MTPMTGNDLMVVIDGVRWRRDEAVAKGLLKIKTVTTAEKEAPAPANKAAGAATKAAK